MQGNDPKKHHYIPVVLLKNFRDANGFIWMTRGNKPFRMKPENAFYHKNLYTKSEFANTQNGTGVPAFFETVSRSYEYEHRLSEIESDAAPAIRETIEQARRGNFLRLSEDLEDPLKRFIFTLARRTPESQDREAASRGIQDAFYQAAKYVADQNDYPLPTKEELYEDTDILRLRKMVMTNVNARFAAGDQPHVESETQRFANETGLCVAVIRVPNSSFIIGSHGLAIVGLNLREHLEAASWLPIAHDVAVGITASPNKERVILLGRRNRGEQKTSIINRATAALSTTIAGRSKTLVNSLRQN